MLREFAWIQNHWNEIMEIPKNNQTDTQDQLPTHFLYFTLFGRHELSLILHGVRANNNVFVCLGMCVCLGLHATLAG